MQAIAERGAKLIWRAVPYLAWRYGARGLAFTRSDAGFLTTLVDLPPKMRESQIDWVAKLLAPRGMPSFLLEAQLDLLGRVGRRAAWVGGAVMTHLAVELRGRRHGVMPDEQLSACDRFFRARTASLPHTRSAGALIAGEIADVRLGHLDRAEATIGWLLAHGPDDRRWRSACLETRALAESFACSAA